MINFITIPQFIPQFCGITSYLINKPQYPAVIPAIMAALSGNKCGKRTISPKWRGTKALRVACPQSAGIPPEGIAHIADTYRPIAEIVDELNVIEAEGRETDKARGRF